MRTILLPWGQLLLLFIAATLLCYWLDPYISLVSQAMMYVLAVTIASYVFNQRQSITTVLLAVVALNYFLIPPHGTFRVDNAENLFTLCSLLVLALVINRLATHLRQETTTARKSEQRALQLQKLAQQLSTANAMQEVWTIALASYAEALTPLTPLSGAQAISQSKFCPPLIYISANGEEQGSNADIPASLRQGMQCCLKENRIIGAGTGYWDDLDVWFIPIAENSQQFGAVCLQSVLADDEEGKNHALTLAHFIAQSCWRIHLTSSMKNAHQEIEHQQLQSLFLSAISHDLRTPLAVVVGAASALQTQYDKLDFVEKNRLLNNIVEEANYLTTVAENTLQLVRLSSTIAEGAAIKRDWESIEEIIGSVLTRVRQREPQEKARRIASRVASNLPLLRVDPVLIAQLLQNLLDNALKYSDGDILLSTGLGTEKNQSLTISVKDRGPGIPLSEHHTIFQAYARHQRHDQSSQRGAGLGLAVCHQIARVHGGELRLRNRQGGGSHFMLTLPIESIPTFPPHQE